MFISVISNTVSRFKVIIYSFSIVLFDVFSLYMRSMHTILCILSGIGSPQRFINFETFIIEDGS